MTRRPSQSQSTTSQTQVPPQQTTTGAQSQGSPQGSPSHSQTQPQVQTPTQPPQAPFATIRSYLQARRRYPLNITSDMHYSQSSNILHVSLELPGVKKQDVKIKLATCYFNHVKFISVLAESAPVFDLPGAIGGDQVQGQAQDTSSGTKTSINPDLRERRFGLLRRIIQVPPTTKVRICYFSIIPHPLSYPEKNNISFLFLSSLSLGDVSF